jgi:hypothetical protein
MRAKRAVIASQKPRHFARRAQDDTTNLPREHRSLSAIAIPGGTVSDLEAKGVLGNEFKYKYSQAEAGLRDFR